MKGMMHSVPGFVLSPAEEGVGGRWCRAMRWKLGVQYIFCTHNALAAKCRILC